MRTQSHSVYRAITCYTYIMKQETNKKRPLIETNPYLRDPEQRDRLIARSVLTSSAVEGIHLSPEIFKKRPNTDEKRESSN